MTCEHCQDLISVFLDNELDQQSASDVRAHLAICNECSEVCEDIALLMDLGKLDAEAETVPPNSRALWCRINNIIESEVRAEAVKTVPEEPPRSGWLPHRWHLSLPQMVSAVFAIAVISSLLTFLVVKGISSAGQDPGLAAVSEPSMFEKVLGKMGLVDTPQQARERRMRERQVAIEYWNRRVEARRTQWDGHFRDAFDRNLNEIDQVVSEYTQILQENPQDELSNEMLDSALNEKMELLRTFSEL